MIKVTKHQATTTQTLLSALTSFISVELSNNVDKGKSNPYLLSVFYYRCWDKTACM